MKPVSIYRLVIPLLLLAGCSGSAPPWHGKNISGLMPNLQFTLVDETGRETGADVYASKINLLFFGFSHCQMVCPVTLSRLGRVINTLPENKREEVEVLFVSVDPKRDDPARLAEYTDIFGPEFIGLTGTQKQLQTLSKRYRVTYGYSEADAKGNYMVSHSNGVYVFDRDGHARLLITDSESEEEIAEDLERLLSA